MLRCKSGDAAERRLAGRSDLGRSGSLEMKTKRKARGGSMKRLAAVVSLMLVGALGSAWGQTFPPNAKGVSMGHLHYYVRNVEANRKFWLEMGATPVKFSNREILKFPGVFVFLNQGEPTGGTKGSAVDHIGFRVPDAPKAKARFQAAGFEVLPPNPGSTIANVLTPEGERVELFHDGEPNVPFLADNGVKDEMAERLSRKLTGPVSTHHVHIFVPEGKLDEVKAWYVKMFGALPGTRRGYPAADLPGMNLNFSESKEPLAPTKGRMLDHIGFEVKNLQAFCKQLEAGGVKFDRPYAKSASGIATAYLTDPWGTYIELTEGLNRY
jgi:catechol 2,3-dioxygenase-like lactoylglutathione lyase family enzyme